MYIYFMVTYLSIYTIIGYHMASYYWFLIHHGDVRRESGVRNGRHISGVCDSPCVTSLPYLIKSASSAMTRSSQLHLTRSVDKLVGF